MTLYVSLSALITASTAAAHNFRRAIRIKTRKIKKWSITKDRIEVASEIILICSNSKARKYVVSKGDIHTN
jgi:hypothetical protein